MHAKLSRRIKSLLEIPDQLMLGMRIEYRNFDRSKIQQLTLLKGEAVEYSMQNMQEEQLRKVFIKSNFPFACSWSNKTKPIKTLSMQVLMCNQGIWNQLLVVEQILHETNLFIIYTMKLLNFDGGVTLVAKRSKFDFVMKAY